MPSMTTTTSILGFSGFASFRSLASLRPSGPWALADQLARRLRPVEIIVAHQARGVAGAVDHADVGRATGGRRPCRRRRRWRGCRRARRRTCSPSAAASRAAVGAARRSRPRAGRRAFAACGRRSVGRGAASALRGSRRRRAAAAARRTDARRSRRCRCPRPGGAGEPGREQRARRTTARALTTRAFSRAQQRRAGVAVGRQLLRELEGADRLFELRPGAAVDLADVEAARFQFASARPSTRPASAHDLSSARACAAAPRPTMASPSRPTAST